MQSKHTKERNAEWNNKRESHRKHELQQLVSGVQATGPMGNGCVLGLAENDDFEQRAARLGHAAALR